MVERGRGRGELIRVGDVHDVHQCRRAFQVCRPQRHHGTADFLDLNGFGLVQGQVADVDADGGDDVGIDGDVMFPRSLKRHEPTREERFAAALRACVRRRRDGLSASGHRAARTRTSDLNAPRMTTGDVSSGMIRVRTDAQLEPTALTLSDGASS